MGKVSKGDLAYIPSRTRLFDFRDGVLKDFIEPENPIHVLVAETDTNKDRITVIYEGNCWHVHRKDVYQLEGK